MLAALVRLRAARVFNAYVRLWAVAQLTRLYADHGFFPTSSSSSGSSASSYDHHHHGDDDGDWSSSSSSSFAFSSLSTSTSTRWVCMQMAFCAASLIAPWRTRVIVAGAFYSRIVDVFFKLAVPGGVRSHDVAAVLFDGAVTLCVAGHVTGVIATWPRVVDAVGRSIRAQLAWLHLLRGEARPTPHPTHAHPTPPTTVARRCHRKLDTVSKPIATDAICMPVQSTCIPPHIPRGRLFTPQLSLNSTDLSSITNKKHAFPSVKPQVERKRV